MKNSTKKILRKNKSDYLQDLMFVIELMQAMIHSKNDIHLVQYNYLKEKHFFMFTFL